VAVSKKATTYQAYSDLAWVDSIISLPDEYEDETKFYVKLIKSNIKINAETLLHLGCGAGGHDYTFKKYFKVTGVDVSPEMLEIARKRNPEIEYICDDMRNVKLKRCFDAVVIPDSIGYMVTVTDLRKTIRTACRYLKSGGLLLITALVKEDFRENNFVYTGSKGTIEVTIFENNYAFKNKSAYEAALFYLIRRRGKLEIFTECHKLGLFPLKTWYCLLKNAGLKVKRVTVKNSYDRFILDEGKYHLQVLVCVKSL